MNEWWNSIPAGEKIYWYFAFPFTALFIIQTALTIIGLGDHGDIGDGAGDSSLDTIEDMHMSEFDEHSFESGAAPFRLLTIRNFIVFFTIFAWTGIVCLRNGFGRIITALIACASGLIVSLIISTVFYVMTRLVESGGMSLKKAVNCTGEVYLTIPAKRKETGKVTVIFQGVSRELDAVTDGKELPTGTHVIVTGVVDNRVLLVEKYK